MLLPMWRFERGAKGEMELLAIEADVDYRIGRREGCGRAWALLEKRTLRGRLFIDGGHGATFVAEQ